MATTNLKGSFNLQTGTDGIIPSYLINGSSVVVPTNTNYISTVSDLPAAVAGVHQLATEAYIITAKIDLGTNVLNLAQGTLIQGYTAEISGLTTNSASPLITGNGLAFEAVAIKGGLQVDNTGTGAVIRCEGTTIMFLSELLSLDSGGVLLEIHNNNGGVAIDKWTGLNGVDGIVMTGAGNTGPIISSFNPIGFTGKGIYINGDISSGALRINDAIIGSFAAPMENHGIEIASGVTIQGMSFSGDCFSNSGNGIKIAGTVAGGISLDKTNILSKLNDAMDIVGGRFSSFIASSAGITAIAAGKFGLVGEAASANITTGAGIVSTSFIDGVGAGGGALSGLTKKDIKWEFNRAGPEITDSTNVGAFSLDAPAVTTPLFQGANGTGTAFADSTVSPGTKTKVLTAATPTATDSVSFTGTTSYNGLFTATNIVAGVSFDIGVAFVADDGASVWESGWIKVAGSTTDLDITERFTSGANNNEIQNIGTKTMATIYHGELSALKAGATQLYEFALFMDSDTGIFEKVDGSVSQDVSTRASSLALIVPGEMVPNAKSTVFTRNMDGTGALTTNTMTVTVNKI